MNTKKKKKKPARKKRAPVWQLHLYVVDTSARSILATGNLERLCEQYLKGQYRVTVIDIIKEPELAREREILATPTLVRVFPGPEKTVIGCLSDTERVLRALQIGDPQEQLVPLLAGFPTGHA
jgi:circadian clock protein KaiB